MANGTSWFAHLDSLLRGRKTGVDLVDSHARGLALGTFVPMAIVLGLTYGFFMGWYAVATREDASVSQLIASTVKLPALFLLTLGVTFPSLYVFSALIGCRLSFAAVLRLLVATIVVNLAVAASLGPILGFFTLSTKSYSFMVLLNVALLAISGFVALGFLLKTLQQIGTTAEVMPPEEPAPPSYAPYHSEPPQQNPPGVEPRSETGTRARLPRTVVVTEDRSAYGIFYIWVLIYGLVGAQMGWILRPFIGNPSGPFQWFRPRDGNFFQAVFDHIGRLVGGPG